MKRTIVLTCLLIFSAAAAFAQTGDPWIKKIYNDNYGREPTAIEYNIQNYNNGHWNNYGELQKYIGEYLSSLQANGISMKISSQTFANNTKVVGIYQNGTQIAANLVSLNGGAIVAQGGGNIVAQGGGNIVAQGGGNIVAQGGGNIAVNQSMKGASFGGAYSVASAGTKIIKTSGSGAMIIH